MSDVYLNVYDISAGMAKQFSQAMIGKYVEGIWHTGIVVYDREFFFGGGICEATPKTTPYGFPVKEIKLGKTEIPEEIFREYLASISSEYTPEKYDLINKNCNNFSNEICNFLIGEGIPSDIINLPKELLSTPLGKMVAPMIQSFTNNLKQQSGGYAIQQPIVNPAPEESKDDVKEIKSYTEFESLLKSSLGVIADFWSPACGPCLAFKPKFHSFAKANKSSKISFCTINTLNNHETANAYQVQVIPTIYFFYKGNVVGSFKGANEEALVVEFEKLKKMIENTHPHTGLPFKNFQPSSKEVKLENSQKQVGMMIKLINELIESSANKEALKPLLTWVSSGSFTNSNPCTKSLIDNIFSLMKETELDNRLALIDLLRVAVLYSKEATLYMLQVHFDDIQNLVISPVSGELAAPKKKTFYIFAYLLKVLSNSFVHTEVARLLLNDQKYYAILVYLLTTAFDIKSVTVVYSASLLAHNMVITSEDKKILEESYIELIHGLSKAACVENLDAASIYWLAYTCAVCLYMCPVELIEEVKKEKHLNKMITIIEVMDNEKLKNLSEDLRMMISLI